MAKIIGNALPNIPWQDPPQKDTRTPFWRYSENPIIGRDGNTHSNSVFNSAVVPFGKGFALVSATTASTGTSATSRFRWTATRM